VFDIQMS